MKSITFIVPDKKVDLLLQIAKELDIKTEAEFEIFANNLGLPGPKISVEELDYILSKGDEESFGIDEAFDMMKSNLGYSSAEMKEKIKRRNGNEIKTIK